MIFRFGRGMRWFCFGILLAFGGEGFCQNQETIFHKIQAQPSQQTITKIDQDEKGFLWVGTRHGLNRFDGREFLPFIQEPTAQTSIIDNRINDFLRDDKDNFWLATNAGLAYFNQETRETVWYQHDSENPESIGSNLLMVLERDFAGNIIIGTESEGLSIFDPETKIFTNYRKNQDDPFSIPSNRIRSIIEDESGNIWVGFFDEGLALFDKSSSRFISYNGSNTGFSSKSVRVLTQTDLGIAIGSNNGISFLKYNGENRFEFKILPYSQSKEGLLLQEATVLSVLEDNLKNIWIGTENKGLFKVDSYSRKIEQFVHSPSVGTSVSNNSIWSLFEDNTGIIWIGTYNQGLTKVDPLHRNFKSYTANPLSINRVSFNIVSSFLETPDQSGLWVGTDGGGLDYLDYSTNEIKTYRNQGNSSSLAGDAVLDMLYVDNDLWVASWEGGVSILKQNSSLFTQIKENSSNKNSLLGPDAFQLFRDSNGNVWVSVFRYGIDIYDPSGVKITSFVSDGINGKGISNLKIRCIIEPVPGEYWLGTEGDGVEILRLDKEYGILGSSFLQHAPGNDGLSHNVITDFQIAEDRTIWIATFGGGIDVLDKDKNTIRKLGLQEGLSSDVVLSLQEDQTGNIWAGTSNGLSRISKNFEILKFDDYDGLQGPEFLKGSSYINKDGDLFFGGTNGYNRFHPDNLVTNENKPEVVINQMNLLSQNNEFLAFSLGNKKIQLTSDQNDFEFQFSILNYTQSTKNKSAYRLKNYDDAWIEESSNFSARYTNVPPGNYVFQVRGSNNDGLWNEEGDSVEVFIQKPFYASMVAFLVYSIVFIGLLLLLRKFTVNRERLKNELHLEQMELGKAREISEMKSQFFANISHEFRTPLALILGPLKSLIGGTYKGNPDSQFRIMARNAERLLQLINQILELSKLESGTMKLQAVKQDIVKFLKPIVFAFNSYADKESIDFEGKFPGHEIPVYFERDKMEKIVINLISNAFKYSTDSGKIIFSMEEDHDHVILKVSDSGLGIPEDQLNHIFERFYQVDEKNRKGTGIGLALTKELVELQKGEISVESVVDEGTTFSVYFKKGSSHLDDDEILVEKIYSVEEEIEYEETNLTDIDAVDPEEITETNETNPEELPVILIAEDNEDMRSFVSEHLVAHFKILEAEDGAKAKDLAFENIPDVIVTDVMMPELTGYELCEVIKKDERTSHIPVVLLTAKASSESTEMGFEMGADYYITKPFNPKLLELRIKNILKTRDKIRDQLMNDSGVSLEPKVFNVGSKDQEFLNKIMEVVEEHYSNSLFGIDDLCQELGMSRTKLYRKLKGLIGQSANEFIRSFRLKRAAQILKQQEMTISEVTYLVGFNDLQYFRYCFKEQFGMNPSEYAQSVL